MIQWFHRLFAKPVMPIAVEPKRGGITGTALEKAMRKQAVVEEFAPYMPPDGVIPAGKRAEAMAMDATPYDYVNAAYVNNYFPGYQYLSMLAQLPEYRKMSEVIAKETTRKWIKLRSKSDDDDSISDKIAKIEDALDKFKVRQLFRKAAELDGFYGRAQIFIDVDKPSGGTATEDPDELASPLFMSPAKIKKGALKGFRVIEPIWTYPSAYNATDPLAQNYYKPHSWYVMGKTVHASRLLQFVSREVPDLLKSAYNFGGLSMSQMAQPYVQNFIRTRDSVSDVVHAFSVSGVKTNMSGVLSGTDDAQFFNRAQLFNTLRDNRGLMLLDKDTEEFFQVNTPLSGLDSLQAQSQEQMSAVSSIPLVKLLGITPSGLNASADGEIQVFYDHIASMQSALFADPLTRIIQLIQLDIFGEIDPDIVFEFVSLYELNDSEKAIVRKTNAETDGVLVSIGAISPDEARARVAADPESGYDSLEGELEEDDDTDVEGRKDQIEVKAKVNDDQAMDAEFNESDHPRAENGEFGSGGGLGTVGKPPSQATPHKVLPDGHPLLDESINDQSEAAKAERSAIAEDHFINAKPVTGRKPVIYFMGGGGGAGKGTLKKELQAQGKLPADSDGAVTIDPDEIKMSMKRFKDIKDHGDYRASSVTHEDSSKLSKQILEHAKRGNYDIIFDVTLSDASKAHARFKEFKDAGYDVHVNSVLADPEEASKRAFGRWEHSGRYVPSDALREAHENFGKAVDSYEKSPHVDHAERYENFDRMTHVHTVDKGVKQ